MKSINFYLCHPVKNPLDLDTKRKKEYSILISGLKEGRHTIEFKIGDAFFEEREYSEIKKGDLLARIGLIKQSTLVLFEIHLSGTVHLTCDRCLDEFDLPLESEQKLVMKIGSLPDQPPDPDEEIIHFPSNEKEFDISNYIYEYIVLALPIRRVHSGRENGENRCDPAVIGKLESLLVNETNRVQAKTPADPRWEALRKLKLNLNTQSHAKSEAKNVKAKKK